MAKLLKIPATPKTPLIEFDAQKGILTIEGRSLPEDSTAFYEPLVEAITTYGEHVKPSTIVNMKLEYFNTGTTRRLLTVFKKLQAMGDKTEVTINWYYDDDNEDMLQAGEDYRDILNVPFKLIEME